MIGVPDKDPDVRIAIQHSIKVLGIWTALLYGIVALFVVISLVIAARHQAELHRTQEQTGDALCTFRNDLQTRYDNGVKFLVDHPDGIPGIPAEVIQQTLKNQADTLKSLEGLPCPPQDGTSVLGAMRRPLRSSFIEAVNRERTEKGCRALKETGKYLIRSARRHSRKMANQDRLFHSDLHLGRWSQVGEVVGVGPHWQNIFQALMDSREHRRILLGCIYDRIAVGIIESGGRTWLTGRVYAK